MEEGKEGERGQGQRWDREGGEGTAVEEGSRVKKGDGVEEEEDGRQGAECGSRGWRRGFLFFF